MDDILTILQKPQKTTLLFLKYGENTRNAIVKVATLLKKAIKHPASNDTQQSRVKGITLADINQIPDPIKPKDVLPIVKKLEKRNDTITKDNSSKPCPYKQRIQDKKEKKRNQNIPNNIPVVQAVPPAQYYQPPHQNVYLYPNRNIRLPYMPMANPYMPSLFHIFDEKGKKQSIDDLLRSKDKAYWNRGLDNEMGRLSNGIPNRITGSNTINFIHKNAIPKNKKVTYANLVCDFRPHKEEKHRVRLTLGGDKLEYYGETASPAANLLETKILINIVISDSKKGARFASLDIKDFFLQSTLPEKEYLRIHERYFSPYFRQLYKLQNKINKDGYVYCEIIKGMYGLKQAAILAYKRLKNILEAAGYKQIQNTTGLWKHKNRQTKFALCVDDFGVKYFTKDDLNHLIQTLQKYYVITIDKDGKHYCGLTFDWHYQQQYVDVSMPGYVEKALKKYGHKKPSKSKFAPHIWASKFYEKNPQQATPHDTSAKLSKKEIIDVQSKIGTFLYYG